MDATHLTHTPSARAVTLLRTGDYWTAQFAGRTLHVQDSKGLADLALLLAQPGQGLHVLQLVAAGAATALPGLTFAGSAELGLAVTNGSAWDEPLDPQARAAYLRRYTELAAELEEAQQHHDAARMQRLGAELELLLEQLEQRQHVPCAATERARKAVYNRVRAAIRRIGKHDREFGWYLEVTVKTGIICRYQPEYARYAGAT